MSALGFRATARGNNKQTSVDLLRRSDHRRQSAMTILITVVLSPHVMSHIIHSIGCTRPRSVIPIPIPN